MEPNPAWADRILAENWNRIEAQIGRDLMPFPSPGTSKKISYTEYGCGHYGCVYPTREPGKVFKITSDMTEAAFVSCFLQIYENDRPSGIVSYDGVWEIPGAKHKNRSVFVLIREEAVHVGWMNSLRVIRRLDQFRNYAGSVRKKIKSSKNAAKVIEEIENLRVWAKDAVDHREVLSSRYSYFNGPDLHGLVGARAAAFSLRACEIVAETMGSEDLGYLIGETLGSCLEEGLLLADVHEENVGQVNRGPRGDGLWVITDPGHLVPMSTKWLNVQVGSI